MSTITITPIGLQTHRDYGVGLVLQHSSYYSIAPKQRKLRIKLQLLIEHLCVLSLVADFYESEGLSKGKSQQIATKVSDKDSPLPSAGEISAATRHCNNGANGAPSVVVLFSDNRRHSHWWILYCPTLESYGSEAPNIGDKRAGSPGSSNQFGEKKQRSGQQNNGRNDSKGNKGDGQGPGKKKRGFGPHQPFIKKLACLFFKLDPRKYQCCAGYDLTKWDHVLQHLKRMHIIRRDHCPKCRKEFGGEFAEAEKNEHIRQDSCAEKAALGTGLLLQCEYDDLAGLHGTHEEKWFKAWEKLFGEHPVPHSPFFETVDCILEVQHSTLERELPTILQSFRRDTLARPEVDTTSATTDDILRLLRNPIPTSNSLIHEEAQAVSVPSAPTQIPWFPDIPPSYDLEPWPDTMEPFRPSTGDLYDQPTITTMEATPFGSRDMSNEVLSSQPLEEPAVFVDVDDIFRRWMNHPDDGHFFEELEDNGHAIG
ncbi:uncharacterized protein FFB20_11039 [Fusarium fujikuroi]|uniref:Uncharacterized protein n=1 Tax=Fusarium fujikuroi TaxID=5127 RepID=A0A2H3SM69_FUSFU|nr:uncharacterized protein Y057_13065 [Fusarium fujikuroi]QGI66569.1 hypothetical protein CEK27_010540 [Fusarium fujikuroi]QGI97459.1 hypothetical protein CEK26_010528 [Fusarium fujikuroi]SCN97107.1 uncharacterized protein FFE2_08694 [Fusarium fujikuroi]SCN99973.1 uncharacterized protein FFB20_11039 [Fusarium fujikuroi]